MMTEQVDDAAQVDLEGVAHGQKRYRSPAARTDPFSARPRPVFSPSQPVFSSSAARRSPFQLRPPGSVPLTIGALTMLPHSVHEPS
jgi:hypothetical protein